MEEKEKRDSWPPDLPYDYSGMSLEKALIMIEAAKKKAEQMGLPMTIVVDDAAGNMAALQRMDDAPPRRYGDRDEQGPDGRVREGSHRLLGPGLQKQ